MGHHSILARSKARRAFLFGKFIYPSMHALGTYFKHVREEMQHITWPSTTTAVAHTLVVILISALIALMVGVLDYLFAGVVSRIVGA